MTNDELLAVLRQALEERDKIVAEAQVERDRIATAIASIEGAPAETADVAPDPAKPKASPRPAKPKPATAAAKRNPKPCCGSLGPRHKASCGGASKPAALTAVPDPVPDDTPESRHPSTADLGHYECSSCTETFTEVGKLVSHTLDTHNRVPRPAERVPIPA
jgi:hypothetical protein